MVSESVHSSSTEKITPEIKIESEASDRFLWSEYGEKLHPAFGSWFSRTLLYILQGVESNLDLAQEKMFFRDVQVRKIAHIFRKFRRFLITLWLKK